MNVTADLQYQPPVIAVGRHGGMIKPGGAGIGATQVECRVPVGHSGRRHFDESRSMIHHSPRANLTAWRAPPSLNEPVFVEAALRAAENPVEFLNLHPSRENPG